MIYLDSADLKEISESRNYPFIEGVTTNPKLIAKALGRSRITRKEFLDHVKAISKKTDGTIFVQTNYTETKKIIEEAREIHSILKDRVVIKLPATITGLQAMDELSGEDIRLAATAVFTGVQAYLAMVSGAEFVIPYYSRTNWSMQDGMELVQDILDIAETSGYDTRILVASIKNPFQVLELLREGVDAITMPLELIGELLVNSNTIAAVREFESVLEVVKEKKKE